MRAALLRVFRRKSKASQGERAARAASRRNQARTPPVPAMLNAHIAAVDAILSQPQPDAIRDGEITRILPHLLLGDAEAAWDAERLRAHCVTHVLNVAGSFASSRTSAHRICAQYRQVDAQDDVRYAMLANHWEEAWAFIESARRAGGVCLLHCMSGVNRSGIIAVAALMESTRMPLLDAIGRCKASRGCLLTNTAFREQLVHFARDRGLLGELPREPPPASRQNEVVPAHLRAARPEVTGRLDRLRTDLLVGPRARDPVDVARLDAVVREGRHVDGSTSSAAAATTTRASKRAPPTVSERAFARKRVKGLS